MHRYDQIQKEKIY
jgi:hypothetical protein